MKKISAVLLVLVLVGSVVFASFTGSATTSFGWNLDDGTYGFANPADKFKVDLVFNEAVGTKLGEGDVYADLKATFTFKYKAEDVAGIDADNKLTATYKLNHLKIVAENWWVDLVGAAGPTDWAKSAIEKNGNDPVTTGTAADKAKGITLNTMGYTVGIGVETNWFYGSIVTPAFDLADGFTAKMAAAGSLNNTVAKATGSVKVDYAREGYSAFLASDVTYDGAVVVDVAAQSKSQFGTVDVYYASAQRDKNNIDDNLLSVKYANTFDPITLTLTGKNLLNTQALSAAVDFQATDELKVNVNGGYTIVGGDYEIGGGVTYTTDFTAKASVLYKSAGTVKVDASVESTKLVNGATLSLAYGVADILTGLGTVTAKAVVTF